MSGTAYWPAFLTTWRGKVLERTVYTTRAPLGASGHGMPCPYILKSYVEHGEQAQRSSGGPIACFGRQVVRNAGLVGIHSSSQSSVMGPQDHL